MRDGVRMAKLAAPLGCVWLDAVRWAHLNIGLHVQLDDVRHPLWMIWCVQIHTHYIHYIDPDSAIRFLPYWKESLHSPPFVFSSIFLYAVVVVI